MLTSITAVGSGGAGHELDIASLLSADTQDRVRAEANRWIKRLRLVPYGDVSMRERFTYRGDSLWWFTEIYLHKMRRLEDALATIFMLEAAVERTSPQQLVVTCTGRTGAEATRAFARTRGLDVEIVQAAARPARVDAGLLVGVSAVLSRLRPTPRPPTGHARVAAFVHTAFWRGEGPGDGGREAYIGTVLDAVAARVSRDDLRLVGVGPRRNFRARRWWDPVLGRDTRRVIPVEHYASRPQLSEALALWRNRQRLAAALTTGDGIRAAGFYGDYDLWPVLSAELADAARVQWTWSARAMDEARAALTALAPEVAVTYAEAGGWGRALVLEARRLAIPTIGLQHGFIYRHWLNYQHDADEMAPLGTDRGFPAPSRTLLFDRYAEATLKSMGHFLPDALRVTGSPRLDELLTQLGHVRADRATVRRQFGVADGDHLLVLAAKASEIAPHLDALFTAVTSLVGVRLVVKPHPAEPRDVYVRRVRPGAPVEVLDPHADLGRLLAVADGLVTMNSTVAIDALVLGVPALVVGLPNNLSPFVDADVMAGAPADGISSGIERLLYDRAARAALLERGKAFVEAYQMRADGGAADRAADHILAPDVPRSHQP
jgi:hypothetical protein